MRRASADVELTRFKGQGVYLELGTYVASMGEAFELRAARSSYSDPVRLTQVLKNPGGSDQIIDLPAEMLDGWNGLSGFFRTEIKKLDGTPVIDQTTTFCPNGFERQRVGESGPTVPTYPAGCWNMPFQRGMVWGINADWAVSHTNYVDPPVRLREGRYTATVSITQPYIELFGLDPSTASTSLNLRVRTYEEDLGCGKCPPPGGRTPATRTSAEVPTVENPDTATLPDLAALPACGMSVGQRRGRTFLSFGATVWNSGPSPLVVEGYRRSDENIMDGYQYFYADGEPTGKSQVGTLGYDKRDGHTHWHFQQFAGYSLLSADRSEIIRSKKEAFCLAPTDPIDLTIPNADWQPGSIGFESSCGQPNSLWIRETLPVGWGDTYFQGIPGQSFNITNLPNGTYYIAVEANPGELLHEVTSDNNVELREIILKGSPDNRRVVVPPWNGIDTESGFGR